MFAAAPYLIMAVFPVTTSFGHAGRIMLLDGELCRESAVLKVHESN